MSDTGIDRFQFLIQFSHEPLQRRVGATRKLPLQARYQAFETWQARVTGHALQLVGKRAKPVLVQFSEGVRKLAALIRNITTHDFQDLFEQ